MPEKVQRDFLNARVLARLSGLPLFARFPMVGNVSGRHRSPIRGSSLEFAEYRKYVLGDDTRRLDWRVAEPEHRRTADIRPAGENAMRNQPPGRVTQRACIEFLQIDDIHGNCL